MVRTRARDEREAREQHALRLAFATVRRWRRAAEQPDEEELLSAALYAAAKALQRFTPGKGASFRSYCIAFIRGELAHAVREWRPYTLAEQQGFRQRGETPPLRLLSLSASGAHGQTPAEALPDTRPGIDPQRAVLAAEWQRAIAELPEREAHTVRLYHYERLNQDEIAARLGVSQNAVSRYLRAGHRHLRDLATARGLAPEGWVAGQETTQTGGAAPPQHQAPEPGRAQEAVSGA